MKSKLTLLFALTFVFGMFSITSSGQGRLEKARSATKSSSEKAKSHPENWTVVVVDLVAGNTQRIKPRSNSKLRVVVTDYPPNRAFEKQLDNPKRPQKTSAILKNTSLPANRTAGFSKASSKNFFMVTIPILVNPVVRTLIISRRKDE